MFSGRTSIGHFQFGFNRYISNQTAAACRVPFCRRRDGTKYIRAAAPYLLLLGLNITDTVSAGGAFIPIGPHTSYQGITDMTWIRGRHSCESRFHLGSSGQLSSQPAGEYRLRPASYLRPARSNATGLRSRDVFARAARPTRAEPLETHPPSSVITSTHVFVQDEIRVNSTADTHRRFAIQLRAGDERSTTTPTAALTIRTGNYLLAVPNPVTGAGRQPARTLGGSGLE